MFERSFRLPSTVRADRSNAEFRDGVLTLTVPKAEEAKPRQITINVHDGGEHRAGNGSQGAQESASTARPAGRLCNKIIPDDLLGRPE